MSISERIARRVGRDYPASQRDAVIDLLESVELGSSASTVTDEGQERVHAAMLIVAAGNVDRLLEASALAEVDWRDVLVDAGLEHDDWRARLADVLGPHP